jgi:hypothetical protein
LLFGRQRGTVSPPSDGTTAARVRESLPEPTSAAYLAAYTVTESVVTTPVRHLP